MHLGDDAARCTEQFHAAFGRIVKPPAVGDVLVADGKPDPPPQPLSPTHIAGPPGVGQRIALGWRRREFDRRTPADHFTDRRTPADDLAGRQHGSGRDGILDAQLNRIQTQRPRQFVHLGFVGHAGLHRAEAPHRAAGWVVRVDGGPLHQRVGHFIGPGRKRGRVGDDRSRGRRVGAAVNHDPGIDAGQHAAAGRAVAHPDARGVPVHMAVERLLARIDHFHGLPGAQRQQAGMEVHAEVFARSKRAADAGEMKPHLVGGQVQTWRNLIPIYVQPLCGDVQVDAPILGRDREP